MPVFVHWRARSCFILITFNQGSDCATAMFVAALLRILHRRFSHKNILFTSFISLNFLKESSGFEHREDHGHVNCTGINITTQNFLVIPVDCRLPYHDVNGSCSTKQCFHNYDDSVLYFLISMLDRLRKKKSRSVWASEASIAIIKPVRKSTGTITVVRTSP